MDKAGIKPRLCVFPHSDGGNLFMPCKGKHKIEMQTAALIAKHKMLKLSRKWNDERRFTRRAREILENP
jgi:hypothetical protein